MPAATAGLNVTSVEVHLDLTTWTILRPQNYGKIFTRVELASGNLAVTLCQQGVGLPGPASSQNSARLLAFSDSCTSPLLFFVVPFLFFLFPLRFLLLLELFPCLFPFSCIFTLLPLSLLSLSCSTSSPHGGTDGRTRNHRELNQRANHLQMRRREEHAVVSQRSPKRRLKGLLSYTWRSSFGTSHHEPPVSTHSHTHHHLIVVVGYHPIAISTESTFPSSSSSLHIALHA